MKPIEVLLVDQDADVRYRIRSMLAQADVQVVAEAAFGTEAVARAIEARPDVICCALEDPPVRGLETIEGLLNALPETPIVVYSSRNDIDIVRKAMLAGAREFLVYPFRADAFESAARAVLGWEEQRRLRLSGRTIEVHARGTVVAVFSAKGGVGKTTFATGLASALASDVGQSVAMLDADTTFGDVLTALNLSGTRDLIDFARSAKSDPETAINDYLVTHSSGMRVLPGPRNPFDWSSVEPDDVQKAIDALARSHDYVVVDLCPSPNPITLSILGQSSIIFWLVGPEVFTLRDNMLASELLHSAGIATENVRFVVNHVSPYDEISVDHIEAALSAPVYWEIPYDKELNKRVQLGVSIGEGEREGKAATRIVNLARELAGVATRGRNGRSGPRRGLGLLRAIPGVSS